MKECSLLATPWFLLGLTGLRDLEFVIPPWPYLPLLLGPFSAHFSSTCFNVFGYLQLQHPTFPALSIYLCHKKIS